MSSLLPKLDLSHLGKPSEERQALDWLGYFDVRDVVSTVETKKSKTFTVKYQRHDKGYVLATYTEVKGATSISNVCKVAFFEEI